MEISVPDKIGEVKIRLLSKKEDPPYSDREAEDILLELFSGDNPERKRKDILNDHPSWALYYHLTPRRANLIRWYEFKDRSSVLEVGAGPGAITEELVKRNVNVTSLELTKKRALINAYRNRSARNLEIVVGNLSEYKTTKRFDYVICIGVLEYAGTFFETQNPYRDFLLSMQSLLSDNGKLLLAIENRLGLKYWAGAKEDHVHTYFEGHNGYPSSKKVQTFGREELLNLLGDAGLVKNKFYYPYPDYKTPHLIYSDDFHPGKGMDFPLGSLPTPTLDRNREYFFSEQSAMRFIEANKLFPDLSNSFLIESSK
jgi:SAM-dependent methyltransferase